jgi:hypothetical protein
VSLTKEEAIAKAQSGWWKGKTPQEIVSFQLYEDRLCMPFGEYHAAIEKALGRPVWTHEFADPEHLRAEFEGRASKRTPEEVVQALADKIGPERVIVVATPPTPEGEP